MMKYCKILFALIYSCLTIIFLNCSKHTSESTVFTQTLIIADTLKIPVDAKTSAIHSLVKYNENKSNQEIYFVDGDNIKFYDIDRHQQVREINLPLEGPNGTQGGEQVLYISDDTIFVKGHNPLFIHQINSSGKKIKTFDLSKNTEGRVFYSNSNSTLEYYKRNLYIYLNAGISGDKIILDAPAFFSISTDNGLVSSLPFKFPLPFRDDSKQWVFIHYNPGVTLSNNELLVSFPLLDSLYAYSIPKKTIINQQSLPSNFQTRPNEVVTRSSNMNVEKAFYGQYQTTTAYNYIIKDDYRNVYYRFVLHSKEYEAKNGLIALEAIMNEKPISIQIINKELRCIGEIELPKKRFAIDDYFVGKNGLYISNNHPGNPKINENILSYSRFVLSKL